MSIRRKTCETMTLLYEAALKTTSPGTEDEPSSRPNNVNPTPGVHVRENYGKSVFIKDPTRPGGGVFVAQSQDEKLQAGLQPTDIVLASEYGPGSTTRPGAGGGASGYYPNGSVDGNGMNPPPPPSALAPGPGPGALPAFGPGMDTFQSMQMGATNVNPNININLGQNLQGLGAEDSMILNAPNQDVSRIILVPPGPPN